MKMHLEKGKSGEDLAVAYLNKRDFQVIVCNWRFTHYEIDIIAIKNEIIHFIEVKTRHSDEFGHPEEGVNRKKFRNLQKAAAAFLARFNKVMKIQFDILAITRIHGKETAYFFIEDVYMY